MTGGGGLIDVDECVEGLLHVPISPVLDEPQAFQAATSWQTSCSHKTEAFHTTGIVS